MLNNAKTSRFTATLPTEYLNELKEMAREKQIPSVNFAIKEALDEYLRQTKKTRYDALMKEAAQDKDFLERTLKCSDDFHFIDCEVPGEW